MLYDTPSFVYWILLRRIEVSLDTLLWRLFELLVVDADFAQLAVAWNHRVEFLAVLFHDILQFLSAEVQRLRLVEIRINQTHELFALQNHHALGNEGEGIEFVFHFFWIDVLP